VEQIQRFKGGLSNFMNRHCIDILCIQEVKLGSKMIAQQARVFGADLDGFESFWACNEGGGQQRHGLNGVATFARKGLVRRADPAPLQSPELDTEGRCVMTDHGSFVLFNVYVPNGSGGPRIPFKLKWLHALRSAMQRARSAGKSVFLAGDLNMKHRPLDVHWSLRSFNIAHLCRLRHDADAEADIRETAAMVALEWPAVEAALREKEVRPIETRNSRTGQLFRKFGIFARNKDGEMARVGQPVESEDEARFSYSVHAVGIDSEGRFLVGAECMDDCEVVVQKPGMMSMVDFAECLKKLAGVDLPCPMQQRLSNLLGELGGSAPIRAWFQSVLEEDSMVDTFLACHPAAEERFTCWDQYRNKRFENVGARIDYVLVDKPFFDLHAFKGDCELASWGAESPNSSHAALRAASLGGMSEPVGYEGGGQKTLEEDEYMQMFRADSVGPSTGMIYTPPQLSDHIAVSLLLRGDWGGQTLATDATTLRSQPQRSAKRITDFFTRKPSVEDSSKENRITDGQPPAKRMALG